jgi:hypothetical protein
MMRNSFYQSPGNAYRMLTLGLLVLLPGPVVAQADVTKLKPEAFQKWGQSETVVTARLTRVIPGPVGLSEPPLYTHRLQFRIDRVLRGPLKKGEELAATHSIRQKQRPTFPEGKDCLVSLSRARNSWRVSSVQAAGAEEIAQAEQACLVPLGWSMKGARLLSPWATLGKGAWPADAKLTGAARCAVTGRPGLLVGPDVEFAVAVVPPKVAIKFQNPDGDGEYRVTVKNRSNRAVPVPALLSDGKQILWADSLVILCQGKVYPIPGAKGVKGPVESVVLKPGQEVSTTVNALRLQGPEWPRGGYRIEFIFCLGDRAVTQSFYYFSRHHDPIRAKLQGK